VAPKLERGWQAFCELRDILRLSDAELPRGDMRYLSTRDFPEMEMARLRDIEIKTMAYREEIRERIADSTSNTSFPETIILNYLDRYANHLFGHPARFDEDGKIIAVVERTNNVAEHFFGADKQKLRRRLGRANLGRDLEDQPAQAILASNLRHPDYVRLLSGSLENLPTVFAKLDQEEYREVSPLQRSNKNTKLLKRIRVLVADEQFRGNNRPINQQTQPLEASATEI
jgi:hypothetical protein